MTANIRFDNPADGDHAWAPRRPAMEHAIRSFAPHILGTQEGREPQLRDLEQMLLPELQLAAAHRSWIEERMYPCLFFDPKFIELENSGDIWLSETPQIAGSKSFDSTFPRLVTWMKGVFKETKQSFLAASIHLDHMKSRTREQQAKILVQELKPLIGENDIFVLLGDFNESPQEDVRQILHDGFENLYDPWFILDKPEEFTHHDLKGESREGSRIDWILVNRKLKPFDIFVDKSQKNGIYPSDHFPVKAVLSTTID